MMAVDGAVSAFKVPRMCSSAERLALGSISGSEEDAVVTFDTGQDDSLDVEMTE
jgi:hypothetical protein